MIFDWFFQSDSEIQKKSYEEGFSDALDKVRDLFKVKARESQDGAVRDLWMGIAGKFNDEEFRFLLLKVKSERKIVREDVKIEKKGEKE